MEYLNEDAKAILLLCGRFSGDKGVNAEKPLSLAEYNRLADWMVDRKMRPADLLASPIDRLAMDGSLQIDGHRIQHLLGRGAAMALAVEKWTHNGIWIVCRSDVAYPQRLKKPHWQVNTGPASGRNVWRWYRPFIPMPVSTWVMPWAAINISTRFPISP